MTNGTFKALVLNQKDGNTTHSIENLTQNDLPDGDVQIAVEYSSLNFKDALAITGEGKIVRQWPMVPGIDLAGTVSGSDSAKFKVGDHVVLTGWGVGERYWGGYTQTARVKSDWLVPLPYGMDSYQAMALGTAGLTAMLCVMTLDEANVTPDKGTVLVTGAAGGVGSVAIAILASIGYRVAALTTPGQEHTHDYLRKLGAAEVISGSEWAETPRSLETQRWSGAIDTVGSKVLARVLSEVKYGGAVAACGLAGGTDLPTSVMPFILRGVSLRGVDSVMCPIPRRKDAWARLARDLPKIALTNIAKIVTLEEVPSHAEEMLRGRHKGRVVIDLNP